MSTYGEAVEALSEAARLRIELKATKAELAATQAVLRDLQQERGLVEALRPHLQPLIEQADAARTRAKLDGFAFTYGRAPGGEPFAQVRTFASNVARVLRRLLGEEHVENTPFDYSALEARVLQQLQMRRVDETHVLPGRWSSRGSTPPMQRVPRSSKRASQDLTQALVGLTLDIETQTREDGTVEITRIEPAEGES